MDQSVCLMLKTGNIKHIYSNLTRELILVFVIQKNVEFGLEKKMNNADFYIYTQKLIQNIRNILLHNLDLYLNKTDPKHFISSLI